MKINEDYLLNNIGPYVLRRNGKYRVVTVLIEKRNGENIPHWQDDNTGQIIPIEFDKYNPDEIFLIPELMFDVEENEI